MCEGDRGYDAARVLNTMTRFDVAGSSNGLADAEDAPPFVITTSHGRREGPRGLHGAQAALAAAQQPPRQEAAVLGQLVVAPLRGLRRRVRDELEDASQRRGVFIIIGLGPDQERVERGDLALALLGVGRRAARRGALRVAVVF